LIDRILYGGLNYIEKNIYLNKIGAALVFFYINPVGCTTIISGMLGVGLRKER
jgi:hypothetical protein